MSETDQTDKVVQNSTKIAREDGVLRPVIRHESGVRIQLSHSLWLESVLENKPHLVDSDRMLKSMQNALRLLYIRFRQGNAESKERIFAIHELLYPTAHSLPASVERGLELRHLMCQLSYLVVPVKSDATTVLTGPVQLTPSALGIDETLYAKAKACFKKGATLKSLAVRVFLMKLESEGFETIDEKLLLRDLRDLSKWDKEKNGGAGPDALRIIFSMDESLPYQFHAQKWRTRKGLPQFIGKVQGEK